MDPGLKLAITLRFLATGNSYRSLASDFRVAHNTISLFVPEVCDDIGAEYQADVFQVPTTLEGWRPIAERFGQRWNFHHCCGPSMASISPLRSHGCREATTTSYNYKSFFSIVLLGVVGADYKGHMCQCGG